ncbi:hypothetical protein Hypma_000582 [Hypsizygus marmoreus]|uniref:DUF6534 domain-containing protein n=1 Tax=Hypsizygus marmoreus TaxID=39966 RepID=A0A369J821_HYPMA|nr:hypothetical protein Hypma_000582 [Hypsizygus marmoreus]
MRLGSLSSLPHYTPSTLRFAPLFSQVAGEASTADLFPHLSSHILGNSSQCCKTYTPFRILLYRNIALLNGPLLLGNLFGYGLFGILVTQIFIYHHQYPGDPIWLKSMVWGLLLVDVIITVLGTVGIWNSLAAGWGDLAVLVPLDWPYVGLPFLSGLVSSTVHLFFSWRIWMLRRSLTLRWAIILPSIIMTISLLQWAMASFCGIYGQQLGIPRIGELTPFVMVWLGGSSCCDLLITVSMVTILFQEGARSAFKATTSITGKLIRLTIETGMATAAGALAELILFAVFPNNNMHFLPFLFLSKLYSNTLLATLNSRSLISDSRTGQEIRPPLWDTGSSSGHVQVKPNERYSDIELNNATKSSPFWDNQPPAGVHITTVIERREDFEMVSSWATPDQPVAKDSYTSGKALQSNRGPQSGVF